MPTGDLIRTINAHTGMIQDLSFAEDNKTIISGSIDGTVKSWNVESGENTMTHAAGVEVWSLDVTSNGNIIMLGCADGTVRLLSDSGNERGRAPKGGK
jgi:WD40 repeat protein